MRIFSTGFAIASGAILLGLHDGVIATYYLVLAIYIVVLWDKP